MNTVISTENAIQTDGLCVNLSGFSLQNINLTVPRGMVVGLIGANGAGKTTLIRTLTDLYAPNEGTVYYSGRTLSDSEAEIKGEMGIVYDELFYPQHKRAEVVARLVAPFYPDFEMDRWKALMQRFDLPPHRRLQEYSKGMQMKFMLAMVLARRPRLLILDEPTAGLDPAARTLLLDLILEFMQDEQNTVLFSTHITTDLDKIADYIALMQAGHLTFCAPKDELLDRYALVQVEKSAMTNEVRALLSGVRENSMGYIALCRDKSRLQGKAGIRLTRPTVEDLVIYGG